MRATQGAGLEYWNGCGAETGSVARTGIILHAHTHMQVKLSQCNGDRRLRGKISSSCMYFLGLSAYTGDVEAIIFLSDRGMRGISSTVCGT